MKCRSMFAMPSSVGQVGAFCACVDKAFPPGTVSKFLKWAVWDENEKDGEKYRYYNHLVFHWVR